MSKFTLPINWQENYWDVIDFTDVVEVHGKLREDFIGGGRLPCVDLRSGQSDNKRIWKVHNP